MLISSTYEQTPYYNVDDPTQVRRTVPSWPFGYATYFWNRVPDAGSLKGLGFGFTGLPQPVQIGLVTAIGAVVGYFGYKKFGPALKKIGLGSGRRRR